MDFFVKRKNDILLVGVLALAGLVFAMVLIFTRSQGAMVVVTVDGEEVYRQSLLTDTTKTLLGFDGGSNTITIRDGQVAVTDADCPDGLCMSTGYISTSDQSIICLPHKLVVSIEGVTDQVQIDGVAQ